MIGLSPLSEENEGFAEVRTEPSKPSTLVQRLENMTTDTQINCFAPLLATEAETGLSPTLHLNIWIKQLDGTWESAGEDLAENFIIKSLSPGEWYSFKYRA